MLFTLLFPVQGPHVLDIVPWVRDHLDVRTPWLSDKPLRPDGGLMQCSVFAPLPRGLPRIVHLFQVFFFSGFYRLEASTTPGSAPHLSIPRATLGISLAAVHPYILIGTQLVRPHPMVLRCGYIRVGAHAVFRVCASPQGSRQGRPFLPGLQDLSR